MSFTLSNSPASIVQSWLVSEGFGFNPDEESSSTTETWPVFTSNLPELDDGVSVDAICVYDDFQEKVSRYMEDGEVLSRFWVQIQSRSLSQEKGWMILHDIAQRLDALRMASVTVGASLYTIESILRDEGVRALGQTTDGRREYSHSLNISVLFNQ